MAAIIPDSARTRSVGSTGQTGVFFSQPDTRGIGGGQGLIEAGKALNKAGDYTAKVAAGLAEADYRIARREDTILRKSIKGAIEGELSTLYTDFQNQGKFSTSKGVKEFRDALGAKAKEVETKYLGQFQTAEERGAFQGEISELYSKYDLQAVEDGVEVGGRILLEEHARDVSALSQTVFDDPSSFGLAIQKLETIVKKDLEGKISPEEQLNALHSGLEQIGTAAVEYYINAGAYELAQEVMSDARLGNAFTEDRRRDLNLKIISQQAARHKKEAEVRTKISIYEGLGVPVTPELVVSAMGDTVPATMTAQAALDFYRRTTKKEPTADMVAKANDLYVAPVFVNVKAGDTITDASGKVIADKPATYKLGVNEVVKNDRGKIIARGPVSTVSDAFGKGTVGRARSFLTEHVDDFRSGALTPMETAMFFESIVTAQSYDPVTQTSGKLSPLVVDALLEYGIDPAKMGGAVPAAQQYYERMQSGQAVAQAPDEPSQAPEEQVAQNKLSGAIAPQANQLTEALSAASVNGDAAPDAVVAEMEKRNIRFFDMAYQLAGPWSTIQNAGTSNVLTSWLINAPEVVTVRQSWDLFKIFVTASLKTTERFGAVERQDIIDRLDAISGGFFKSPDAVQDGMVGLDDILAVREAALEQDLDNPGEMSGKERKDALQTLNAIQTVRKILNVPPRANSREELLQVIKERGLKPGDLVNYAGTFVPISGAPKKSGEAENGE